MKRSKEKVFFLFSPRTLKGIVLVYFGYFNYYLPKQVPESIAVFDLFGNRIVDLSVGIWYASQHEADAIIAQSVERRHGKAEVNSSILFDGSK